MNQSMRKVASVGTQLCVEACQIIRDCYMDKNTKRFMKEKDDPVTEVLFGFRIG